MTAFSFFRTANRFWAVFEAGVFLNLITNSPGTDSAKLKEAN
jgi:hypothetical protein